MSCHRHLKALKWVSGRGKHMTTSKKQRSRPWVFPPHWPFSYSGVEEQTWDVFAFAPPPGSPACHKYTTVQNTAIHECKYKYLKAVASPLLFRHCRSLELDWGEVGSSLEQLDGGLPSDRWPHIPVKVRACIKIPRIDPALFRILQTILMVTRHAYCISTFAAFSLI